MKGAAHRPTGSAFEPAPLTNPSSTSWPHTNRTAALAARLTPVLSEVAWNVGTHAAQCDVREQIRCMSHFPLPPVAVDVEAAFAL